MTTRSKVTRLPEAAATITRVVLLLGAGGVGPGGGGGAGGVGPGDGGSGFAPHVLHMNGHPDDTCFPITGSLHFPVY